MATEKLRPLTAQDARGRTFHVGPKGKALAGRGDTTFVCGARGCRAVVAKDFGPAYPMIADLVFKCPDCGTFNEIRKVSNAWRRARR